VRALIPPQSAATSPSECAPDALCVDQKPADIIRKALRRARYMTSRNGTLVLSAPFSPVEDVVGHPRSLEASRVLRSAGLPGRHIPTLPPSGRPAAARSGGLQARITKMSPRRACAWPGACSICRQSSDPRRRQRRSRIEEVGVAQSEHGRALPSPGRAAAMVTMACRRPIHLGHEDRAGRSAMTRRSARTW